MKHLKEESLVIQNYEEQSIAFHLNGGVMVNLTEMAKPYGKMPAHFLELESTKKFVNEIRSDIGIPDNGTASDTGSAHNGQEIILTKRGGKNQGTYAIDLIAIDFAAWLDVRFKYWMHKTIREILAGRFKNQQSNEASYFANQRELKHLKKQKENVLEAIYETDEGRLLLQIENQIKATKRAAKEGKQLAIDNQMSLEFNPKESPLSDATL